MGQRERGSSVARTGRPRRHRSSADAIDYFVFPRDTIGPLPPFAVGRPAWDNWMIYRVAEAWHSGHQSVCICDRIHQTHGYGHVKHATDDKRWGPEARQNLELLGLPRRDGSSLDDGTHVLTLAGLARAPSSTLKHRVRTRLLLTDTLIPAYRSGRAIYRAMRRAQRSSANQAPPA